MPYQGFALDDDRTRPEPDVLFGRCGAAAQHCQLAAVEGGVRPEAKTAGPVPVQLIAAVLGQAVLPAGAGVVPERALHYSAATADERPAQYQRGAESEQHYDGSQASCNC